MKRYRLPEFEHWLISLLTWPLIRTWSAVAVFFFAALTCYHYFYKGYDAQFSLVFALGISILVMSSIGFMILSAFRFSVSQKASDNGRGFRRLRRGLTLYAALYGIIMALAFLTIMGQIEDVIDTVFWYIIILSSTLSLGLSLYAIWSKKEGLETINSEKDKE